MRIAFILVCLVPWGCFAGETDAPWRDPDVRFKAVNEAIDRDDFKVAQELLREIQTAAKKAKDVEMQLEATERLKETGDMAKEFGKISQRVTDLQVNAEDKSAATAVGRYECTVKATWKKGFPLLAQGDDAKLAAAAAADLEYPAKPKPQMDAANLWWQLAQINGTASERLAYQLRSRRWMLRAFPTADYATQVEIDRRLKQLALMPDRIVVWNTNNFGNNDRGARAIVATTTFQGRPVWKQQAIIPFKNGNPSKNDEMTYLVLRPKVSRIDEIRIDITKHQPNGGGLSEIEVFVGRENVALGCQPYAESQWENNADAAPAKLVDGDTSGKWATFWIAEHLHAGWATVPLAVSLKGAK